LKNRKKPKKHTKKIVLFSGNYNWINIKLCKMATIPCIHLVRASGLDAFLAYELESTPKMNMSVIRSILREMGCESLPQKITIRNHYSDTVWVEYVYNTALGRYNCISLDEDEDLQPKRKR